MDDTMYSVGNLRAMEIIDINTGSKLGYAKDFLVDCSDYKILSIILPSPRMSWFSKNDSIEIPWTNIKKIGLDVILVDGSDFAAENRE